MTAWSERKLIEGIERSLTPHRKDVLLSIGDDCCELATAPKTLITTDTLVEDVHFDTSFHPPFLLGRKTAAVNLSDIAAMGGTPRFALLSLCLPQALEQQWIDSWLDGLNSMLGEFDCALVGGDTVQGDRLVFTITVLGDSPSGGALYRSGASAGDTVWVSGQLGSAGAGLGLLQAAKQDIVLSNQEKWAELYDAHLNPTPQVGLGQKLAGSGVVSAMQDISDGLATDLAHICKASQVKALLQPEKLPAAPVLQEAAALLKMSVEDLTLSAGEDYQLVFTVRQGAEETFVHILQEDIAQVTKVGILASGSGVFLESSGQQKDISFQGYEH